jgi:hypothetical protein
MTRRIMRDWCSSKMESHGLVFKGEFQNEDFKTRNAFVRVYGNGDTAPKAFLRTSHSKNIFSVHVINYQNQEFLLVSGNDDYLDVFKFDPSNFSKFIG